MKNKYNTLHSFIFDYNNNECTKETVKGLFASVLNPLLQFSEAQACVLLKLNDSEEHKSLLQRLKFSGKTVFSFSDELDNFFGENFTKDNLWQSAQFVVILAQRYSAALLWDYSISDNEDFAKTSLIFNSKIVTDIAKKIFENSKKEDFKTILSEFNADRRENTLLNSAVSSLVFDLNDKNREILFANEENKNLAKNDEALQVAELVAQKAKYISHEIKNNLSIINLYSTIVQKRLKNYEFDEEVSTSVNNALNNIKNASENVSYLISDLRCFSSPYIVELNVKDLIQNVAASCREKAEKAGVELDVQQVDDAVLSTDKSRLECVLINIIYNAIEACKTACKVELNTEIKDSFYNIYVENNGEKIPVDLQSKIFEPNFTTKPKGNGIGLYMCKKHLELVGGKIELVSSDDKETIFKVALPLS